MAITVAFAMGYSVALRLWEEHLPELILHGISVVILSITWMLAGAPGPRTSTCSSAIVLPARIGRLFGGLGSFTVSLCYGWDQPYGSFPVHREFCRSRLYEPFTRCR